MKLVVKVGGSLLKGGIPDGLIDDIASLSRRDEIILVHGGGDIVTEFANRLGKEQHFVVSPSGVKSRYTDSETAEIYHMVMAGLIAKRLVLALGKAGVRAVSVSGVDGGLLKGVRKERLLILDPRGRRVAIEGGYTGKVESVDKSLLQSLGGQGCVPVVSPVAISEKSQPLNLDGDRAAAAVASAWGADVVLFATNVSGLSMDGSLVTQLKASQASSLLPRIGFGMQKKVMASVDAVTAGVSRAIICSGRVDDPLRKALAFDGCTVISN